MGRIWPPETHYTEDEKDEAWATLRATTQRGEDRMRGEQLSGDAEDRRKHLEFIQATISRMATASSNTKSWLLPVVTVTYGYALTHNAESVALLGVAAVALFAYLDANYLRQEKQYRQLYKAVADGAEGIAAFSFRPDDAELPNDDRNPKGTSRVRRGMDRYFPGRDVWASWSVGPYYFALVTVGGAIAVRVM